jgi:multicomponent Na+:H+ antiporter subunit D
MLAAMAAMAALCIAIGSFPGLFYRLLPYAADYEPYRLDHVVGQMQLLFLSALAFTLLVRTGIYPPELRSTNLDVDWLYRGPGRRLALETGRSLAHAWDRLAVAARQVVSAFVRFIAAYHGPEGVLGRTWPTGNMAFWTTIILAAYLILFYI